MDTRLARGILRAHRVLVSLGSFFFFQAEDGIRDWSVTGVQTCALPILGVVPGQKAADAAHAMLAAPPGAASPEIGRASCRERVKLRVGRAPRTIRGILVQLRDPEDDHDVVPEELYYGRLVPHRASPTHP